MSIGTKTRLREAIKVAEAFRALFDPICYAKWEFAGSIRRRRPECGDIEHVIQPAFGELVDESNLFAAKRKVNLLWYTLDTLVRGIEVTKHWNGSGYTWGEKSRRADFRGISQDIYTADADTWGPQLAIRTGSADFSKRLVTGLLKQQRRQIDGYVWNCRPCPHCDRGPVCVVCNGTGLDPVDRLSVGTEREYFELAGVKWTEVEERT